MKLSQFLEEDNGRLSSARLLTLLVTIAVIIDWMHAIFTVGIWTPEIQVIGMVLGTMGFKVLQKNKENKIDIQQK